MELVFFFLGSELFVVEWKSIKIFIQTLITGIIEKKKHMDIKKNIQINILKFSNFHVIDRLLVPLYIGHIVIFSTGFML